MNTLRKTTIATLAGLGALAAAAGTPALSHGMGGQGGPGYGPGYGMMGGMMGPGAGYGGMMGPGHGHGFGNGAGAGFGPCGQAAAASGEDIDVDGVTARMERWLAVQGNDRLKLGKVEQLDDDTITVEIVTVDGSLVQKLAVDRHTGRTQPAK
ncbi:MAG: hypothetical protein OEN55_03005 [Alphaproteobacteria bacterium]|nr:hypothetical protein [Alphaproteobacteria bacterium]